MSQANQPRIPSAAYGLTIAMGCFMAVFALVTIGIGLGLDTVLNTNRRIATLFCVVAGMPVNLVIAIWLTRKLLARMVEMARGKEGTGFSKADAPNTDTDSGNRGA